MHYLRFCMLRLGKIRSIVGEEVRFMAITVTAYKEVRKALRAGPSQQIS